MYIVPKHIPKIYLVHRSGERWEFKNIKEAATELYRLGYYGGRIYDHDNRCWRSTSLIADHFHIHRQWDYELRDNHETSYDYIVRDEFGEIITENILHEHRERKIPQYRRRYRRAKYNEKTFRNGPVPYTSGSGGGQWNRNIKTSQERREAAFLLVDEDILEYNIKIRPNRNISNIPTCWDDRSRSDWNIKNWKKYRNHQWREKKE